MDEPSENDDLDVRSYPLSVISFPYSEFLAWDNLHGADASEVGRAIWDVAALCRG